ncbi:hypothetical protein [Dyadobacter bucti]|uniref:hypothetical protein n=1 Tax=Dyadobacter bucti TaxID=2572203 RepID=UPI001109F5D6|nr:hypothetical protein [Dyadobacter bucti]
MKEIIKTLNNAIIQLWPEAVLLARHQSNSAEPASYWYLPNPWALELIRIFPRWEWQSFYLSCFRSPDRETLEVFTRDLQRFGSDILMLPYGLQNMEVHLTEAGFLINKVGIVNTQNSTLVTSSNQLISYAANGFE